MNSKSNCNGAEMNRAISRRGFIASCAGVGATLLNENSFAFSKKTETVPSLEQLRFILEGQRRRYGCPLSMDEITSLNYAYRTIKPTTHTETAISVWAGLAADNDSYSVLVDEYCRRRSSESAKIFDHPLLQSKWCREPDTFGVIVFTEQLENMLSILTADRYSLKDFYPVDDTGELSIDIATFSRDLNSGYCEEYTAEEIDGFYRIIQKCQVLSYVSCSSLVEQALMVS